jgi:hypothetical protein
VRTVCYFCAYSLAIVSLFRDDVCHARSQMASEAQFVRGCFRVEGRGGSLAKWRESSRPARQLVDGINLWRDQATYVFENRYFGAFHFTLRESLLSTHFFSLNGIASPDAKRMTNVSRSLRYRDYVSMNHMHALFGGQKPIPLHSQLVQPRRKYHVQS